MNYKQFFVCVFWCLFLFIAYMCYAVPQLFAVKALVWLCMYAGMMAPIVYFVWKDDKDREDRWRERRAKDFYNQKWGRHD